MDRRTTLQLMVKRVLTLFVCATFYCSTVVYALPEGGQIIAGSGSISQQSNSLQINQNTDKMVINWQGFNTTAQEQVKFIQPSSSAMALNRITSGLPTTFAGLLSANGQVWIINPAGILFTSTSKVDVASLVATTLNIQNSDFMQSNYKFNAVPGFMNGAVINEGEIIAHGGNIAGNGLVALVAPGVENKGVIQATLGKVALASGNAITLDLYGDQLIQFALDSKVQQAGVGADGRILKDAVANNGTIKADGGQVLLTANTAANVVNNVVSMNGVIEAKTISQGKNGVIILGGDEGKVLVSGTIDVSANKNGDGGNIKIKGHHTTVTGKLLAKGGSESGNGGFVETSGDYLDINQMTLDLTSAYGNGGSWLIDPYNITVVAGSGFTNNSGTPLFTPTGNDSQIGADLIVNQLNVGTDVTLATAGAGGQLGNITINAAINKTVNNSASLHLQADNNVMINAPITLAGTGSLYMSGVGNGNINAALEVGGGLNISMNGTVNFTAPVSVGQNLSVIAPGGISQNSSGTLTVTGNSQFSLGFVSLGSITLNNSANDFMGQVNLSNNNTNTTVIDDVNSILFNGVLLHGDLTVNAGDSVSQTLSGLIKADTLTIYSTHGVNLASPNNLIDDLIITNNGAGNVIFNNNQELKVQRIWQPDGGSITVTSNGDMNITDDGMDTLNGSITLTANGVGSKILVATDLNAGSGTLTFNGPVILKTGDFSDHTFSSGSIIFNDTLNSNTGSEGLIVDGSATFNNVVGGIKPLKYLTVTGSSAINTSAITTTLAQNYTSLVNFGAPAVNLTGSTISFLSPINGNSDVTITGDANFNSLVGFLFPLKSLHVTGTSDIYGTMIKTQNQQMYDGPVVLHNSTTLQGSTINVEQTLNGAANNAQDLIINGDAVFKGQVGNNFSLKNLTITGNSKIETDAINTGGQQTYDGAVTFKQSSTALTGSAFIFNDTVDTASDALLLTDLILNGNVTFNGAVGSLTPLSSLIINGNTVINGSYITTTNHQNYNGVVTLNTHGILQGNNIVFANTVDAAVDFGQGLLITGNAVFNAPVGSIHPLVFLIINGDALLNTNNIITGGIDGRQTYNGILTLTQNTQLNAGNNGDITFNDAVNGNGFNLTILNARNVYGNGLININNFTQQNGSGSSAYTGGINATNNITINTQLLSGGFFTGNIVSLTGITGNFGTVNANQLFLGGNNGSDIINTFVAGQGNKAAADATKLLNGANGAFYVNGFLVGATPEVSVPANTPNVMVFDTPSLPNACLGSDCKPPEIVIDNGLRLAAGYVSCMLGFATAIDANGDERILMPGDAVYADEKIMTDAMSKVTVKYNSGKKVDVVNGEHHQVNGNVQKA